jgi:hypothetical protein
LLRAHAAQIFLRLLKFGCRNAARKPAIPSEHGEKLLPKPRERGTMRAFAAVVPRISFDALFMQFETSGVE